MLLQSAGALHVDSRAPGDTMTVLHPPSDITAVERVFRWFFSVPQWLELTGAALAILIGIIALFVVWHQRAHLIAFARRRRTTTSTPWKIAVGIVALSTLAIISFSSVAFYTYSQQNNQFCLSCHTLHDEVFERFQQSKHHTTAGLRCHDCHEESLLAETRQIVYWMTRRPSEVGPHAPVPRAVCANCHIQKDADSSWKRIIATAGHSVHLLSDTAKALHIDCITCHGVTAHRFVPVGQTCAQSGCHDRMAFHLGKMAGQSALHCTVCHNFTAPVGEHVSQDSAKHALVPVNANCQTCHAMQQQMAAFVPAHDPHKGRCGDCHNPHTQATASAAWLTCTNSGCHARPDTLTSFHRGIAPAALAQCSSCHKPHDWKVSGNACLSCHKDIYSDRPAMRLVSLSASSLEPFQHSRHRGLECAACHTSSGAKHGALLIHTKTDCLTCHHGAEPRPGATITCVQCHQSSDLARAPAREPVVMHMSVTTVSKTRLLPFNHTAHTSQACVACHSTPVTRAVGRDCTSCHASHHVATASCITCHAGAKLVHRRQDVHQGCAGSGCHQDRAALELTATRNVCLTCHNDKVNHKAGGECAKCHQVQWKPSAVRQVSTK